MTERPSFPERGAVRAVLFDLDHTLLDVHDAWRDGFIEALGAAAASEPRLAGDPQTMHDREYRPQIMALLAEGDGDWDSDLPGRAIGQLFSARGVEDPALLHRTVDIYHRGWLRRTELFPDARAALDALGGRLPLGLITDGATREQRAKIEHHDLAPRFEVMLISREVGARKPHPPMFERALAALDVPARAAIYVGDNPHRDVTGALGMGMGAVWVNRDGADYPADAPPPHHEVATLTDLLDLIE